MSGSVPIIVIAKTLLGPKPIKALSYAHAAPVKAVGTLSLFFSSATPTATPLAPLAPTLSPLGECEFDVLRKGTIGCKGRLLGRDGPFQMMVSVSEGESLLVVARGGPGTLACELRLDV